MPAVIINPGFEEYEGGGSGGSSNSDIGTLTTTSDHYWKSYSNHDSGFFSACSGNYFNINGQNLGDLLLSSNYYPKGEADLGWKHTGLKINGVSVDYCAYYSENAWQEKVSIPSVYKYDNTNFFGIKETTQPCLIKRGRLESDAIDYVEGSYPHTTYFLKNDGSHLCLYNWNNEVIEEFWVWNHDKTKKLIPARILLICQAGGGAGGCSSGNNRGAGGGGGGASGPVILRTDLTCWYKIELGWPGYANPDVPLYNKPNANDIKITACYSSNSSYDYLLYTCEGGKGGTNGNHSDGTAYGGAGGRVLVASHREAQYGYYNTAWYPYVKWSGGKAGGTGGFSDNPGGYGGSSTLWYTILATEAPLWEESDWPWKYEQRARSGGAPGKKNYSYTDYANKGSGGGGASVHSYGEDGYVYSLGQTRPSFPYTGAGGGGGGAGDNDDIFSGWRLGGCGGDAFIDFYY